MECYACTATSQLTPSPVQVWTDPTEEITSSNRTETTILPAMRRRKYLAYNKRLQSKIFVQWN